MVSAGEALGAAIHDGFLEKKRRTGGWTKKRFVLTPTQLLSFDSLESSSARSSLATLEVLEVLRHEADPTQRGFFLALFRKKKEYRAASSAERDAWIEALASVAGIKKRELSSSSLALRAVEPVADARDGERERSSVAASAAVTDSSAAAMAGALTLPDLRALCDQLKRAMSWQLQTSKSFAARDVVQALCKLSPGLALERAAQIGQELVDGRLLVPLQSHVFDEADAAGRFKFAEPAAQRQPKNHLNMRAQSIADLMGHDHFDANKYAEDFLRKHASDKIDAHCAKLVAQKEQTIEELKEEISSNYTAFIRASAEIKTMENSVSQLKALVVDCKRSLHALKAVALEATPGALALSLLPEIAVVAAAATGKRVAPAHEVSERKEEARAKSSALNGFIYDLEVSLHERDFARFTAQTLEYFARRKQGPEDASDAQHAKVLELRGAFVQQLVEDFNASMQASERMHKKEEHLQFLITLGQTSLATEMCLQNYSVRMALQLRHVPSYGNALNYVINLSRTFFSSLLVCYEDFALSFRGQSSAHFVALTVWISAQLERFASEVIFHAFPNAIRSPSLSAMDADGSRVAIDVPEFKNVARYVSSALRYVFYGSRQLELAGLPTAHCLAPHLVPGIDAFLDSYASSVKSALRDEVKRERWEMMKRSIRDPENKVDSEIILTQSGRSFYSMVQQYLRDAQRVLNPSCATSYLEEVYDAVTLQADELLLHYSAEAVRYLTASKASSSLRPKQLVGLLTNVAYIHEDCAARSAIILMEFVPKAVLQATDRPPKAAALWGKTVEAAMKRCAESLLAVTINWRQLDLSDEALPDVSSGRPQPTLFIEEVLKELDGASNAQLDRALTSYCGRRSGIEADGGGDGAVGAAGSVLLALVAEALLGQMLGDSAWWQQFDGAFKDRRRMGCGGASKFLAEVQALGQCSGSTPQLLDVSERLAAKVTAAFEQSHVKGAAVAPQTWLDDYVRRFARSVPGTTASPSSVS